MRTPAITAIFVVIAVLAAAAPAHASNLPADFEEHTLADGFWLPTAVAWAPNGRMFVTQLNGEVFTAAPGSTTPAPLLNLADSVNAFGDRGLLGMAVDSAFSSNHYLYLLYTHERLPLTPDGEEATNSQLLRVTLNADGDQVVDQEVILGRDAAEACPVVPSNVSDCIPSDSDSHSIGSVRSAPDGTLFLGSGDASDWNRVDERALRTYDERSMAGKIMHVDRDGRGLPGHPFCPADSNLDHVCAKLYAKGFRNPYRFKLRPGGGLVVGDVGWTEREEIDLIGAGGSSYGWPCYEGVQHTPDYRELDACEPEYEKEADPATRHLAPNVDYAHDGPPEEITGNTVLGGPTYTGDQYPEEYRGRIFVGDYGSGSLLTLDTSGQGAPVLRRFADGLGPFVDLETTLAGDLAYVSFGDYSPGAGSVKVLSYSAVNHSPVAQAAADPASGEAPLSVQFDGSGSSDLEDDALEFDWDFGDGSPHSSQESPVHEYEQAGRYTARLTVDDGAKQGSATVTVQAGTAPSVEIVAPSGYRDGEPVALHAEASDDEALPDAAFSWQLLLRHNSHYHPFTTATGPDASFTARTDHDADSHLDVRLTVTDADGLITRKTVQLLPQTAPLKLLSRPAGAPLSYSGRSVTGPFETQGAIGFQGSASAAQRFSRNGRDYVFEGWDDGGGRTRPLAVPDGGLTLTAAYRDVTPAMLPPAPAPPLPPPDRAGPRLGFNKSKGLDARKGLLKGTSRDPAGVKAVYVALGRATPGGRCRWWAASAKRLTVGRRPCSKPLWIRAQLVGSKWTAKLRRKQFPAGAYRVVFRAVDKLGNVSRKLANGASMERVRVMPPGYWELTTAR